MRAPAGHLLNTVKRYARAGEPDRLVRAPQYRPTLVDPFRDHLRARHVADPADLLDPREENAERLNAWIATVRGIDLPHLHAFTRGLDLDKGAVRAAVTLPFHNSGTEGVNTKSKRIMRKMPAEQVSPSYAAAYSSAYLTPRHHRMDTVGDLAC